MKGCELTPWMVRQAYTVGVFPMAERDGEIFWYEPRRRALFPIEGVHLSRSMQKFMRRMPFRISFDRAFEEVMRSCLRPVDNWLSEDIIRVFTQIHHDGWAHSCEVWNGPNLVGGVYGVAIGTCFSAESMFHRETNASKVALWAMIEQCRHLGFKMFDAQILNPHLESLGAFEMPQSEYLRNVTDLIADPTPWSHSRTWDFYGEQRVQMPSF
ncbi:MAG: leucyl/phenylalanyl-tRNA--protein transferase [Armatimonadetes bacterium]|nr:leucyl/phenylalanyl-tRNA--protein transferase [Armatimonadota bacterium]